MTPRNQLIAVAAILALAGTVDFVQRIHVPRSMATREPRIETPVLPEQPLPLASARQRLQSWLPPAQGQTPASGPQVAQTDGATEPHVAGRIPDRLDIGGWRFVLRGVFDAGPPFAVLDVMPSAGGAIEQHRLSAGEAIKGVRVERIDGRSVSLSDGENVMQLALFIYPRDDMIPANENNK